MSKHFIDQIKEFKDIRDDLSDLLGYFPTEKSDEKLFDGKTVKQLIFDITIAELFLLAVFKDLNDGKTVIWEDPYDDSEPVNYPKLEFEDLYDDFLETGDLLLSALDYFPTSFWNKKFWNERPYTPQRLLEIETKHYSDEYIPEVSKYIEDLDTVI